MVFSILASLPTCVVLSIIWTVLFRACWMSSKLGFITIDGISNTISAWKSNQIKPEELTKEERKKGYQMDEKKTENGKKRNTKWHCYWQCCLQSTFHMHGMHFITKRYDQTSVPTHLWQWLSVQLGHCFTQQRMKTPTTEQATKR